MNNNNLVNVDTINYFNVGKVKIVVTNPKEAETRITKAALEGVTNYICVSNMRTVVLAQTDKDYCCVMNEAMMCIPDGMPLTWLARLWGLNNVQRTDGPSLFVSILSKSDSGLKHFLLGDTDETLAAMKAKFCEAQIVGTYSPSFCSLDNYNYKEIASLINESGANIVWISMRAPKQDYMAKKLLPYLDKKLCIGVGAAFRFALGVIKHPNKTIQKLGLTGFFWRKIGIKEILVYLKYFIYLLRFGTSIILSRIMNFIRKKNI